MSHMTKVCMSKVKLKIYFLRKTSTSFDRPSCHLAQISNITRPCVSYMIQVFMSKVKVTGQGQMENLFPVHNFYILCRIIVSLDTNAHHNKTYDIYVGKISMSKVTVTTSVHPSVSDMSYILVGLSNNSSLGISCLQHISCTIRATASKLGKLIRDDEWVTKIMKEFQNMLLELLDNHMIRSTVLNKQDF